MPEPCLHELEREFEAALDAPVDAPRRVEVAQRMQSSVLCFPPCVSHTRSDLRGVKGTFNNVLPTGETAVRVGEGEAEFALGAGQLPFPERVDEHRRQRDRALARHGLD